MHNKQLRDSLSNYLSLSDFTSLVFMFFLLVHLLRKEERRKERKKLLRDKDSIGIKSKEWTVKSEKWGRKREKGNQDEEARNVTIF